MHLKIYDNIHDLPKAIRDQLSYPIQKDFFLSLDWFLCLFDATKTDTSSYLIACLTGKGGNLIYALLLARQANDPKTLGSLTNFYSIIYGPSFTDHNLEQKHLFDTTFKLLNSENDRLSKIELRFIPESLVGGNDLYKQYYIKKFFMYENWFISIGKNDFESFYNAKPSKLKNTIRRKTNNLKKNHDWEIKIFPNKGDDLNTAINDYIDIYNNSWKKPEPYINFIPNLIKITSKHNILRLGILYIDQEPAASQLWITSNNKATIYKLAYKDKFSQLSPGSILSYEMFKHAIDIDHVRTIDYGIGSEPYKRDWMDSVRNIQGMDMYPKNLTGRIGLIKDFSRSVSAKIRTILQQASGR